jgi:hypothetical protein
MRILRFITTLTAVNYAALIWMAMFKIMPATQGLKPFDLRFFGYSYDDALTYLATLNIKTTLMWLGPVRWLDTSFPLLLTITMSGWGWVLSEGLSKPIRALTIALPLIYLVFDYLENFLVAKMIAGILPSAAQVQMASSMTVWKFIFVAACALVLAALAYRDLSKDD